MSTGLAVRWTIGDVSAQGFEALRLSVESVIRLFGQDTFYVICVNSVSIDTARARTGKIPDFVWWRDTASELPDFLKDRFDRNMSEGVGWKFAPLRISPDRHELSLDNDVILWDIPQSLHQWLAQTERCLIAEDVQRYLGQFDSFCPQGSYNSGIRGLPPNFEFGAAVESVLLEHEHRLGRQAKLASELDEQGLQVAAVSRYNPPLVVPVDEVTICSPFWPKRPNLGRCGAHFVGLNARHLPWNYYDRPALHWIHDHWNHYREALYSKVGIASSVQWTTTQQNET